MTTLRCENLSKLYPGTDFYALGDADDGVSFEVEQGELFALLGPSGCGKTTTLRIIGGFIEPTGGRVMIEDRDVTDMAPYERPTNTVFQSYALFPHLSVGANVEFGLKMEGTGRAERRRRAQEALDVVGLGEFAERRVSELSGGQQQRAALARAMVKRPSVLLLDEPFGALDLKLRRQMQDELVQLKLATGTTFVHVTHDQEEACAIADRIAVMSAGRIVQVDTPVRLYQAPRTSYVANFLNAGAVIRGQVDTDSSTVCIDRPGLRVVARRPDWTTATRNLAAVLPPDRVSLVPDGAEAAGGEAMANGTVDHVTFTGSVFNVHVKVGDADDQIEVVAAVRRDGNGGVDAGGLTPGASVGLTWDNESVIVVEDVGL